jgi:DNA-binding response OmpR family regulator
LARHPDLVILDINLPRKSGREVLRALRQSPNCGRTPVLVVTSSDSQRDRDEMANLGASLYFRKPSDYNEFMKLGDVVKTLLAKERPQ